MPDKEQPNDISTNESKQPTATPAASLAAVPGAEDPGTPPPVVEVVATTRQEDESSPTQPAAPQAQPASHEFPRSAPQRPWLVWTRTILQPVIFAACIILFFVALGVAQKLGWLSTDSATAVAAEDSGKQYICPMMCVPPQNAPGRCPVCGMELVELTDGNGQDDPHAVTIPPAARRVANIQTAIVRQMPISRTIRAIGELTYDESARKTLSAYVDGRVEKLYADYTGVQVTAGDRLALIYSPKLYTSQVSFLLAKRAVDESRSATLQSVIKSNTQLLESSRQRLQEMGMTADQISKLEEAGEADSRVQLSAPISGTVIEKLVAEGQYIKEGQAIYELADLGTVWLMLRLFPEDAAAVRYGQRVAAEIDSLPGEEFVGRVAFIDPNVDPKTRTVGVRVVFPNPDGRLRIGDYAKARVNVPLAFQQGVAIYDPDLANKWISPRHPHVIESAPGDCPLCGIELVPASQFGYADEPVAANLALAVPRDAVLMAAGQSIVYVETEPGRFEIRPVVLGSRTGDQIVVLRGVAEGEQVATNGNFLVDSQMQLARKPSLIDPTKLRSLTPGPASEEVLAALSNLAASDRALAEQQLVCPVTDSPLGSMGTPLKVGVEGRTVFICCAGCEQRLIDNPSTYIAKLDQPRTATPNEQEQIDRELAKLSPEDRNLAVHQQICPVTDGPLGGMGMPKKVYVLGQFVFICCEGCRDSLLASPDEYLAKLDRAPHGDPGNDGSTPLPPVGKPQPIESDIPLPPTTKPKPVDDGQTGPGERTAQAPADAGRGTPR